MPDSSNVRPRRMVRRAARPGPGLRALGFGSERRFICPAKSTPLFSPHPRTPGHTTGPQRRPRHRAGPRPDAESPGSRFAKSFEFLFPEVAVMFVRQAQWIALAVLAVGCGG